MFRFISRLSILLIFIILALESFPIIAQATLPAGFNEILIATTITRPTGMQFAPDGRLFVTEQDGTIRIIENNILLPTPFITAANLNFPSAIVERGLMGIAFDPNFAVNNYIYLYYNASTTPIRNRISRVTANGNVWLPGSEVIIFEFMDMASATFHQGGALQFGNDGKLYVAVGDNGTAVNAQDMTNLRGKILRINADGSIPPGNPFVATTVGQNQAIWAMGLRNSWRFGFQPGSGIMLMGDVGLNSWEELNQGFAGRNYGWPTYEGIANDVNFVDPVYAYPHGAASNNTGCSIIGGDFYQPATSVFPAQYVGDFFFADYCNNWIKHYDPSTGTVSHFASSTNAFITDMKTSPDGALYYVARGTGAVYRIEYNPVAAPVITLNPLDLIVPIGYPATFTCNASGNPPLTFQWQRNLVDIPGATTSSYTLPATMLADDGTQFRCVATNPSGSATSTEATLTVVNSQPPVGTITLPIDGSSYIAGDLITYVGTGIDPEDGALPDSAFTWEVVFHHNVHTHPFIPPFNGVSNGTFTIPTLGHQDIDVWYRIHLTVTDSAGLTHSSFVDIVPITSLTTLTSDPPGLRIGIDGTPHITPVILPEVAGIVHNLNAPLLQVLAGERWAFDNWSDAGTANHDFTIPDTDTTLTATYSFAGIVPVTNSGNNAGSEQSAETDQQPQINIGDPAISKIGILLPGQLGLQGEKLEWVITVTNIGNVAMDNVLVTDTLRPELGIDSVSSNVNSTISGQTVTVTIPALNPGQSVTFSIFTSVLQSGIVAHNIACMNDGSQEVCTAATVPLVKQLPATGQAHASQNRLLILGFLGLMTIWIWWKRWHRIKANLNGEW